MDRLVQAGDSCHGVRDLRTAGMTFVELLLAIAVLAILLTVAAPSFDAMLTGNRLATYSNTYLTHLHQARSEAAKRNARVALCKSANGASCATSGSWAQGWIVFHDANNNAQVDTGEAILRVHETMPSDLVLVGNTPVANYVSYSAMGGAKLTSGAIQAGTLTLCKVSTTGGDARAIVISATGRPRVQTVTVSACP